MRNVLLAISFMLCSGLKAQDTSSCSCITTYKFNYPKKAELNKVSGSVTIEWKVSADGLWSSPIIIKSLGYGCDEEAMKAVRSMISSNNVCTEKCKIKNGREGKLSQTFNFQYTDE